ncbi:MAG: hypothetical protein IJ143_01915 [Neisseriaceae bacterium]|nr:hypothetical protein [Neisseriaceae bacterium]
MTILIILIIFLLFISVFAGWIGNKLAGKKGKYIFMALPLLLLGIIIYNIAEYYYIKNQVTNLCKKEAGIFVYVTPEQWREENKEEITNLYQFDDIDKEDEKKYIEVENKKKEIKKKYKTFFYNNKEYKISYVYNERIFLYRTYEKLNYFVTKSSELLVDIKTNRVLINRVYINSGVTGFMSADRLADLKYWVNNIPNCLNLAFDYSKIERQFSNPSLNKGAENDK